MSEKVEKDIKRNTILIIIAVILLTLTTLSVSYSAFFSVQSELTIQQLRAGVLDVIIDSSTMINDQSLPDGLFPTATSSLPTSANSTENQDLPHSSITLYNDGTIDAEYSVTISVETVPNSNAEAVNLQYINIGVVEVSGQTYSWHDFGSGNYYTPLTTLGNADNFPILRDTILASGRKTYRIYIWLAEETPTTEIGKNVALKVNVKSTTINGRES